jgi:hypothetical protein
MNSRVLIVTHDASCVEMLSRQCTAMQLQPIVAADAADGIARFDRVQPALLFVDESMELKPDWPLYHEIALNKQMRSVPLLLLIDSPKTKHYAFPPDHCAIRIKKGPRLLEAARAFTEELLQLPREANPSPTQCDGQIRAINGRPTGKKRVRQEDCADGSAFLGGSMC